MVFVTLFCGVIRYSSNPHTLQPIVPSTQRLYIVAQVSVTRLFVSLLDDVIHLIHILFRIGKQSWRDAIFV